MYRFQVKAPTQNGEMICIVGSTPRLGLWDVKNRLDLNTSGERYPTWWVDLELSLLASQESEPRIEYKYVRITADGNVQWESDENRWVPIEREYLASQSSKLIVDDGNFGQTHTYPYGYLEQAIATKSQLQNQGANQDPLKILVIGSSVAMGCSAWLLDGWASRLGRALQDRYGHQLVNRSQLGASVTSTIERLPSVFTAENPDIVIIALSLGNEGLAHCRPHDRWAVQRRFESGLLQLIKMTQDLGAMPIVGGLYPHGDYTSEHNWLLRDTHSRMFSWGVPVLDWLDVLDNGDGRWNPQISLDVGHPNTIGHRAMFEAIDLDIFDLNHDRLKLLQQELLNSKSTEDLTIYKDLNGFQILANPEAQTLRIINNSDYSYNITPTWKALQEALKRKSKLNSGTYIAKNDELGTLPLLTINSDGSIENKIRIDAGVDWQYCSALKFFAPHNSQILYYDGNLGILKEGDRQIRVINESDEEYNIHPMWKEVRSALAALPAGVYVDNSQPDAPFRTMMVGEKGLESRVKAPVKSSMIFQYKCQLSEINRIAILPLGDRCAARMLLYKMEYDGPAFPFDLTRSTNLGDVADIVANDFRDMWNPEYLHYNSDERRLYHSKWSGLSFGHEVEDSEDPINNMQPIYDRMRTRYSARAKRFLYTLEHCDEVLFIRTGVTNRDYVIDLIDKLKIKCKGKPFRVLLISEQDGDEFANILHLIHYDLHFSPDWMYDSQDYWMECAQKMREILESLGVSSQNLFWCPPNP
ncbi:MAG: lipase [Oscillatoriales cyanobacterium CG2_30_44_21]|nr:MAG: lipase [Oscillatoriales cyanobacterium CG2_30_44_21]